MNNYEFASQLAWPIVALVGIFILGPGGVLVSIAKEITGITHAVGDFKKHVANLIEAQRNLSNSSEWISELQSQVTAISTQINQMRIDRDEMAVLQVSRILEETEVTSENGNVDDEPPSAQDLSPDEMFSDIVIRWNELTEKVRVLVGSTYDGRAIGQMAWKLSHRSRKNHIDKTDAKLIEDLHSQWKRFGRLQDTKSLWLTPDVYAAFIVGVDRAKASLASVSLT